MVGEVCARRYDTGLGVRVRIAGGRIAAIDPVEGGLGRCEEWPFVAPGFFDLQINGYGGVWFSDERITPEQVLRVLEAHWAYGITRLCPTVITNSFTAMKHGLATIRQTCEAEPWADRMVPGCHVEGPYLSPEDGPRGAHPVEHVRPCDIAEFDRLQEASGGRILLMTLAPEAGGAVELTRHLVSQGVVVSIGHTAANSEQIRAVVDAGATLSTHLGNGSHGTLRRHPNHIWDQLAEDRLSASLIADGHHLPGSVLKTMIRAKGSDRIILTCDASGLAGLPPGEYDYHGARFEVLPEGPIVIAGQRQYLAGSGQWLDTCVANAVHLGGATLSQACNMASRQPAELLGIEVASLNTGSRADLVLFDWSSNVMPSPLNIRGTIAEGELRWGKLTW
ncbi:MAG: amidohydrolase family protein [Planctomycetaceae bacterium]